MSSRKSSCSQEARDVSETTALQLVLGTNKKNITKNSSSSLADISITDQSKSQVGFPALKEEKDQHFPESQMSKANISPQNQTLLETKISEMKEVESSSIANNNQAGAAASSGNQIQRKLMIFVINAIMRPELLLKILYRKLLKIDYY